MSSRRDTPWAAILPACTAAMLLAGPTVLAAQTDCARRLEKQRDREHRRESGAVPSRKKDQTHRHEPSFSAQVSKPADGDAPPALFVGAARPARRIAPEFAGILFEAKRRPFSRPHRPPYHALAPPATAPSA